jgi:excisionase family DNA binding protein
MKTTTEAAAFLGITRQRVSQLCASGELPATKIGRDWLIDPEVLKRFRRRPLGRPPEYK